MIWSDPSLLPEAWVEIDILVFVAPSSFSLTLSPYDENIKLASVTTAMTRSMAQYALGPVAGVSATLGE